MSGASVLANVGAPYALEAPRVNHAKFARVWSVHHVDSFVDVSATATMFADSDSMR